MKGLRFRNSTALVNSILSDENYGMSQNTSVDLAFSTFRSEDYRYHSELNEEMGKYEGDDCSFNFGDFEECERSCDDVCEEEEKIEEV